MKCSLLTTLACLLVSLAHSIAQTKVVAYVPNWIDLDAFSKTIDYGKLTHINIAFENPINDAGDLSFHEGNTRLIERAQAEKVKVLLSIGGGSASGDKELQKRYFALLTPERRKGFAAKLAEVVEKHHLDGLDVDIEGPSINADYGPFIDELSAIFKARNKLLTAALSKGYGGAQVPDSVFAKFDFINIMAYDGAGYWNPDAPGQHSSFEFAKENVAYWLQRGLPREKAILGVPFYGYGFGAAFRKRDYPYRDILKSFPEADQTDQVGKTIYYNGIPTIKAKANYVLVEKLGGIMIWSLDLDEKGPKSLLGAIDGVVRPKLGDARSKSDQSIAGSESSWFLRHEYIVSLVRRASRSDSVDLYFLGDSLIEFWPTVGKQVWMDEFGKRSLINAGISGDTTQNVIYRITHGGFDKITPKVVVLMIGMNNLSLAPDVRPEDLAVGVKRILSIIQTKSPKTKILLTSILPNADERLSQKIKTANQALRGLADEASVRFLNLQGAFLDQKGKFSSALTADGTHLNHQGYKVWADEMRTILKELLPK